MAKMPDERNIVPGAAFLRAMDKYASRNGTIAKGSKEYKARLNYAAEGIKAAVKQQAASKPSPGAGTPRLKKQTDNARSTARAVKMAKQMAEMSSPMKPADVRRAISNAMTVSKKIASKKK